jgi:ferredoxin
MDAIPENPRHTRSTECVVCFDCTGVCSRPPAAFKFRPKPEFRPETKLDLSRRRLLQGAGIGLAVVATAKIDPGRKRAQQAPTTKISSSALIRPPGAAPEEEFVNRCMRCGQCMKACPTGGLQPALYEAGIEGFWTPVLVPRIGCCTQECNACGEVCPTDAIHHFEIEEKSRIFIGLANVDRSRCLAWFGGRKCLVCAEYCSYHAIDWKEVDGVRVPLINSHKCTGCGACESACPVQPTAAIRVYSLCGTQSQQPPSGYPG